MLDLPVIVEKGQRANPVKVRIGKIHGARGSVAVKRRLSTIGKPIDLGVFTLDCIEKQLLVITSETNDFVGQFPETHDEVDHTAASS